MPFIVNDVTFPTALELVQTGAVVSRQTISYPTRSGSLLATQRSSVSLDNRADKIVTPFGRDGANASIASAAALTRATFATYGKSTNSGRSPYCTPFSMRTF